MSVFFSLLAAGGLPVAPLYATLGNVVAIYDSTGLVSNTNNTYGQVDSSNNIGAAGLKSITPGPLGVDIFPVNIRGTGNLSIQMIGGIPVINNNGYASLRNTGGSANWNPFHYNATFANLKWTSTILCRPGFGPDPGEPYGIFGNNGHSGGNKGISLLYDDREGISVSNRLSHTISKGSAGFISTSSDNAKIIPNVWQILQLKFDGSLTAANRMKAWIDGVPVAITVTSSSTVVVTTPTYDFELMAVGNGAFVMPGQMSHSVFQTRLELDAVNDPFIATLIPWKTFFNAHMVNEVNDRLRVYNTLHDDLTKYYLGTGMVQIPTALDTIVQIYTQGATHLVEATKKLCARRSTDRAATWAVLSDIADPTGNQEVQDCNVVVASTGRISALWDEHTAGAANFAPFFIKHGYSDNNGTSFTITDLTSLVPVDGNTGAVTAGAGVANGGFIMHTVLTFVAYDPPVVTSSAIYLLKIAEGADPAVLGNWTVITVKAYAVSTWLSEPGMISLGGNNLYMICRDETTKEFNVFTSSDNGVNWTDRGALTFSETLVLAGNARLARFLHNGVDVTVCYYPDRTNRLLKAIYAVTSDLAVNPITAWKTASKTTIFPDLLQTGSFLHPYNDIRGLGCSAREPNPQTLTEDKLITYWIPTNQEATIESALGI